MKSPMSIIRVCQSVRVSQVSDISEYQSTIEYQSISILIYQIYQSVRVFSYSRTVAL